MDTMHILLLLLLTTTVIVVVHSAKDQNCELRVCYFNNKAQYRDNSVAKFTPDDIDVSLCTHIIYYSAILRKNSIGRSDEAEQSNNPNESYYEKVIDLKAKSSKLKILLTLDAGRCDKNPFHQMSSSKQTRSKFIKRVIDYLKKYKFDGLDLRCVFPNEGKILPEVKDFLSDLVHELRQAFDKEAAISNRLLLTVLVYGERAIDENCYDVASLSKDVDWINLWALDLHGDWYPTTGHPSPLFPGLPGALKNFSVDTAVKYWIENGTPKNKLVMALPSFGRSYTLTRSETSEGAPATKGGKGPYTNIDGMLTYFAICELIQANGTVIYPLRKQNVNYLVSGGKWVGYDDIASIERKILFLQKRRLGGFAFVWIDTDDFKGVICKENSYPLLNAAVAACNKPVKGED